MIGRDMGNPLAVHDAIRRPAEAQRRGFLRRGPYRLVLDAEPGLIFGPDGSAVGVDALVRLFRGADEIPVDPHRPFINPPEQIVTARAAYVLDGRGKAIPDRNGEPELIRPRTLAADPVAAFYGALWDSLLEHPNPRGWRTRGTVSTIFATAPGGNAYVRSTSTTYSTARTGSGSTKTAGDNIQAGQLYEAAITSYHCHIAFVIFDTSTIGADPVSVVVLSLDGNTDLSLNAEFEVIATAAGGGYTGGAVTTSNYVDGSTLSALTKLAGWQSTAYSSAYNAFTSEAAMLTAINGSGNTAFMFFSDRQRDGTAPTSGASNFNERVLFTDADAAGTSTDPKLVITHGVAAISSLLAGDRRLSGGGILSGRLA